MARVCLMAIRAGVAWRVVLIVFRFEIFPPVIKPERDLSLLQRALKGGVVLRRGQEIFARAFRTTALDPIKNRLRFTLAHDFPDVGPRYCDSTVGFRETNAGVGEDSGLAHERTVAEPG